MSAGWFVPGRIEMLGKHTDYAGGRSLLAAVDRGHTVTVEPADEPVIAVTSTIAQERVRLSLDATHEPLFAPGHWSGYLHTVVRRLQENFPGAVRGAEVVIESDLPLAAGMSSSSALVVGLALALADVCGISGNEALRAEVTDRETLAEYLGCIENGQSYGSLAGRRGVGTFGGSEDHTAMLCGRPDQLVQYSFCPVTFERAVPFPADKSLVVAVSGVEAEKTGAARERYNRVSLAAREILERWNHATGRTDHSLAGVVRCDEAASDRLRALASDDAYLAGRLDQFLLESDHLVPRAADALAAGELDTFGGLVDESQRHATHGLGNQIPETIGLQGLARQLGADAASAFGAGFGGSVWALVDASGADDFARDWTDAYAREFPVTGDAATWLVTRPGRPAHRL